MVKRAFDFLCSLYGLLVLFPVFLFVALWIKLDSQGPIFFRQTRVGQFSRPFKIHKFRTMVINAEFLGEQITVGNDLRITKSGVFLRNVDPSNVLEVRYEQLMTGQQELRKIGEFLGLSDVESVIARFDSTYNPINLEKWRETLLGNSLQVVMNEIEPTLSRFGYVD